MPVRSNSAPAFHEIYRQWDHQHEFDTAAVTKTVVKSGRFAIEGSYLKLPEREFIIRQAGDTAFFETMPHKQWPSISFSVAISGSIDGQWSIPARVSINGPTLRPASDTASAEIFYCLTFIDLVQAGTWRLKLEGIPERSVEVRNADSGVVEQLMHRLHLFRRVRLIEKEFGIEFTLPRSISKVEVGRIDYLSRAIEEGTFTIPTDEWIISIDRSICDKETLFKFEQPVAFIQKSTGTVSILDKALDFGPIELYIANCQAADKQRLEELIKSGCSGELRLRVLSGEVVYRFEKYLQPSREEMEEAEMGALIDRIHQKLKKAGALEDDTLTSLGRSREAVFQKLYPNIKIDE